MKDNDIKISKSVRDEAHRQYVTADKHVNIYDKMGCGAVVWATLFFWNLFAGIFTPPFSATDSEIYNMNFGKKTAQRARDMFYPVSNGWRVGVNNNINPLSIFEYKYNDKNIGKYNARAMWYINMACLLVAACWLFGIAKSKIKTNRKVKAQKQMVDLMLKMPLVGVDPNMAKKLMRVAPDIVSHMSRDRRIYFDALLNQDEYVDLKNAILNSDAVCDIAVEIMAGHLESHPEDMEAAIRICKRNVIPRDMLMKKIKQR